MNVTFEQTLAYNCGPALAGIKPSNLISLSADAYEDLPSLLQEYRQDLEQRGIHLDLLCCCQSRCLILVYREDRLERQLSDSRNRLILRDAGYPEHASLSELLGHLSLRLQESGEFPHEIGVFLGYSPEDVIGFQIHKGKNFKYSGHWKVYSDVEFAKACFLRYDKCRDAICRHLSCGRSIRQMFCPAA
ncbi:MAG: DUF3793 family protein [Firmicutes bacterium]|nr:DUF3793 family protein [Bacillota bacterium]